MIGYTSQYVSLAERPKKGLPSAELVTAIDSALQAGGALVELRREAAVERRTRRTRPMATRVITATTEAVEEAGGAQRHEVEQGDQGDRRRLLALAAAVAFGAPLGNPTEDVIAGADQLRPPTRVRPGDVRALREAVHTLESLDHHAGGVAVCHQVLGALRWGTSLLKASATPAVRTDLAVTVAHLADLAGWATFDAGHHQHARQLFLLGLHVAREADSLSMRAHVASGLARQEIHAGNPGVALELVQLAHTAASVLTPNAIAMLHTVSALAHAREPDAAECRRSIGAALDTYRPESLADDPDWIRYFTPAKLHGDLANALFDLAIADSAPQHEGERADLAERLDRAVREYPQSRARSKGIAAARLAIRHEPWQPASRRPTRRRVAAVTDVRSPIDQIAVQDHPVSPSNTWDSLHEALHGATADALYAESGTPVAFRRDARWLVDADALHREAGRKWLAELSEGDIALLRLLRATHSTGAVQLADVCHAATGLGVRPQPDADRLSNGRVWPGGTGGWVGEVGSGPNIRALDDMFDDMTSAIDAVVAHIRAGRDALINALMATGPDAAELATMRDRWSPPQVMVYATASQREAWTLYVPA